MVQRGPSRVSSLDDMVVTKPFRKLPSNYREDLKITPGTSCEKMLKQRVGKMADHLAQQYQDYELAQKNTNAIFNELLDDLEEVCKVFRESMASRRMPLQRIFCEIDPDRSVGIISVFWHTISFTTRGNTKPLSMQRAERDPLLSGRIIALHGHFQDLTSYSGDFTHSELLQYEMASLYVPADKLSPAVMTTKHLNNEECFLHQVESARLFVLKTVEMICAGGYYHEHV